jgi:hypothetical protein
MSRLNPWKVLGIDPSDDSRAIRRAYAQKLKALDLDREIEAYANLRAARDHALALARSASDAHGEAARFTPLQEPETSLVSADDPVSGAQAFDPDDAEVTTIAPPQEPGAPEILLEILFPEGSQSDDALSHEDWLRAEEAVAAIAAEANESPVDRQATIGEWLAHHLAAAWPRSSPLVTDAADRFGWREQSGQITEGHAVQFLNLRLRGMRFVENVQEREHPLHKAWNELSRPGHGGAFDFLRASKNDVHRLLEGVRQNFPEVESYLNPARVASWEGARIGHIPSKPGGSGLSWAWVAGLVFIAIARVVTSVADSGSGSAPTEIASPIQIEGQVNELVVDLFGDASALPKLKTQAPDIFDQIEAYRRFALTASSGHTRQRMRIRNILRLKAQIAANEASFADLIAIKEVKLSLLGEPSVRGNPGLCEEIASGRFLDEDVFAPEDIRIRERRLYTRLLDQGLLNADSAARPTGATIPGFIVEDVLRRSGLSEDMFDLAAHQKAGSVDQCEFAIALLESVLRQPAKVPPDLLRMI